MGADNVVETEIPVSKLQLGMHVVRLDRPWEETDFLLQGFIISSSEEINELCNQCRTVFIEGRISYRDQVVNQRVKTRAPGKGTPSSEPARKVSYIHEIPHEDEIQGALDNFHRSRNAAKQILNSVRLGRVLDLNAIRPVVRGVVDSILRNDSALMWLTRIRSKDAYTAEHSMNVCVLAAAFGKHLGMLDYEIELLALSGLLHDVGKVRCDSDILNKPGSYTPEELRHVQWHTVFGQQILLAVPGIEPVTVDVAHSHHERMDGKGYPRGLSEKNIPYFAKIIAVVDSYDAITGHRVYDAARSSKQALDIIYKGAGTQYDRDLAMELIRFIGIYPPGALVEMSSGEVAIVLESYPGYRLRPKVLVVRDREKRPCPEKICNLMNLHVASGEPVKVTREWPNGSFEVDLKDYMNRGLPLKTPIRPGG